MTSFYKLKRLVFAAKVDVFYVNYLIIQPRVTDTSTSIIRDIVRKRGVTRKKSSLY